MLARKAALSSASIVRITSESLEEILPLPPLLGRYLKSGASAARIDSAMRSDFARITILALQLFEVNVVCPRRNLELALATVPDARDHPAEAERTTGGASSFLVEGTVDLAISLTDSCTKFYSQASKGRRASLGAA
jgi:hypothetical protein